MKPLLLLFALTFCACFGLTQERLLFSLDKKSWDVKRKRYYIQKIRPEEPFVRLDSPLCLSNGYEVLQYMPFRITVQSPFAARGRTFLDVLVTTYNDSEAVIVVDQNQNYKFNDDRVYTLNINGNVRSWDDFYAELPDITLDSLALYNSSGEMEYKRVEMKLGLSKENGAYFRNIDEIRQDTSFLLDLYTITYYSAPIQSGAGNFEFAVVYNVISQDIIGYPGTSDSSGTVFFYQHLAEKDTALNVIPIGFWNARKKFVNSTIGIGENSYQINALSYRDKKLALQKISKPLQWKEPLFNLPTLPVVGSVVKEGRVTLLYFSGSWCQPCEQIYPEIEKLYDEFGKNVSFVTIAVEKDSATAAVYQKKKKLRWQMVYENIDCEAEGCLKNALQISGFPSLVLFGKNGEILFQEAGTNAVNTIRQHILHLDKTTTR